ncbi:HAD family hydrolase [Nitrosopumilus ureiphilus]|uniref:D,D-heptose 1,7-bisphosphate phosphatase n=1 Tax=Nitrosopumilus ureiphilus TaxID=1470067 RepID=A0A7D5R8J3_9ARCH|nr:HAD family hydrolase [Nitrosopumilus ureiphilus]
MPKNQAIFLDRDGVLNKNQIDYVKNIDELEIFPNIGECIKQINEQGYLVIVVTNQSAIGRKLTTKKNVEDIHKHIQQFLKKNNAKIDAFYYCPHLPTDNCDCRKPKSGLLVRAAHDFSIDLKNSWMIGDHDSDIEAGSNIGCKSIKISHEGNLLDIVNDILKS